MDSSVHESGHYFRVFCVNTLPASDFVVALVRPSLSTLAAVFAVDGEDCLPVWAWASALPANDLATLLAPGSRKTVEAAFVTVGPVFSFFAMRLLLVE
ncbi:MULTISPECIES: hypothetical protein [Rhodanobacter]|uniref:Uncharacterized protein n=1 Tax=Rhodanobacter thiooxydans TaxID=416169 RepID=A0A154QEP5_9GAMM|nr:MULTISPECIES: hypothetical protein [Rhodanobacter]KZC18705.1 hypothetical protein RHOFW104R3_35110 [Rhodanobacter denitrificans]KZC22693.1 hypothetical protein RHOFW104T7_17970 [Rhodanobacter thiooxydans]UJJ52746.1 hypothetical protein LRK52_08745 [Rhodanobacter denitrificans]UJJ53406.1 hypothetical protein LRK53_10395 [Rhodanobacter thiooxydans]UJJ53480.1 hypothetical protein LRK53_10805 [Rhodanobacter thiooxydans]